MSANGNVVVKYSKINRGGCATLNMLKIIELYTLNG